MQPTPVFLPGKSRGQRSLAGYSLWGCRVRHDLVTEQQRGRGVERGVGEGRTEDDFRRWEEALQRGDATSSRHPRERLGRSPPD